MRTLTTIGTPVQAFTLKEKWTKAWPLVALYRLRGPNGFIVTSLSDALLGSDAIARQPDQAEVTMAAFRAADRISMFAAMRSMMLRRNGIGELLHDVAVPMLVLSVRDDAMGWRPEEARRTCAIIPDCRVDVVEGTGHVAPLLLDRQRIATLILDFWKSADDRVSR